MSSTHVAPQAPRPSTAAAGATRSRFALAQVVGRAVSSRTTVTFWLAAPGTHRAPAPYRPGQFVTLALPGASPRQVIYRSYSLCGDGRVDHPWEITVKRHPRGVGSGYLHDRVALGMSLPVSAPGGAFLLPESLNASMRLVFVAAGSGITPIYGMLRALAAIPPERRPQVALHYAYHGPQDALYVDAITSLDPNGAWLRQWRYISTGGRRMTAAQVVQATGAQAANAEWYLCGPADLMRAVEGAARQVGVAPQRIHVERFFSPPGAAPQAVAAGAAGAAAGAAARIRIAETGATLNARAGETLLQTLERHGYEADFSCRAGSCGTCRLKVLGGRIANPDGQALTPAERAAGYVESCVARPQGDVTIALDGVAAPLPVATQATRAMPAAGARPGAAERAGRAAPARMAGRAATRRRARWSLAVASIALFGFVWNLTDHKVATASTTSTSTSGSSSSTSSGSSTTGSSNSSNSSSSSSGSSGSSIFSSQPSQSSSSNSSTGAS